VKGPREKIGRDRPTLKLLTKGPLKTKLSEERLKKSAGPFDCSETYSNRGGAI